MDTEHLCLDAVPPEHPDSDALGLGTSSGRPRLPRAEATTNRLIAPAPVPSGALAMREKRNYEHMNRRGELISVLVAYAG